MRSINAWAHRLLIIPVLILVWFVAQLAIWTVDRRAPFEVLEVHPAAAAPGGYVSIVAKVRRDAGRKCGATYARYVYDGGGFRHDMEGVQRMNADAIVRMEKRTPGMLYLTMRVPESATPGRAVISTVLDYECNPVHSLWPIHVVAEFPFTIEPLP